MHGLLTRQSSMPSNLVLPTWPPVRFSQFTPVQPLFSKDIKQRFQQPFFTQHVLTWGAAPRLSPHARRSNARIPTRAMRWFLLDGCRCALAFVQPWMRRCPRIGRHCTTAMPLSVTRGQRTRLSRCRPVSVHNAAMPLLVTELQSLRQRLRDEAPETLPSTVDFYVKDHV
jgi:hypothetical protein